MLSCSSHMTSGTALHALVLVALAGCGARSDLLAREAAEGEPAPLPRDAAPLPLDAGPDLAPPADAFVPARRCALEPIIGEPQTIMRERTGFFDGPATVARGGTFDLLATFFPFDDLRTPLSYGSRFDDALGPAGSLAGGGNPSTTMRAASRGDRLGLCFRGLTSGRAQLTSFDGDTGEWTEALEGDQCEDLAGSGGQWLAAIRQLDGSVLGFVLDESGAVVRDPIPMGVSVDPWTSATRVTATDRGFAWVEWPNRGREIRVRRLDRASREVQTFVMEEPVFGSVPAIAPWPFDPTALAVAFHGPGGVQVVVVDPVRGELLRTEPLAFSMGGDVTPALVPVEDGLVVAMANYGDFDPTAGSVEITVVGSDGAPAPLFTIPTRRGWDLARGGIDADTDGVTIVVHWAAALEDGSGEPEPVTQALTFRCD